MKLATIEKIHSIQPHPNPEVNRLSVAKIKQWPVVIGKEQFKENELVVFIQIDSIVPETPVFEFMRKQQFRVWSARFKGAPSQGLVMPLSILPPNIYAEGDDVTDVIGVTKYERPIDVSIGGDAKGEFPKNVISITDELNALNFPEAFMELQDGQPLAITLKWDGSSTTYIAQDNEFHACSRRLEMEEGSGFPWTLANKYNLKERMLALNTNIAIQCEAVGPKLNGNRAKLKDMELRLFRAKNLNTGSHYNLSQLQDLGRMLSIPVVDLLQVVEYNKNIHTIEWFADVANNVKWPTTGEVAEGIVIAPVVPFYSQTLGKMWSVKIINICYKQ